jgi:hypothetical protein
MFTKKESSVLVSPTIDPALARRDDSWIDTRNKNHPSLFVVFAKKNGSHLPIRPGICEAEK